VALLALRLINDELFMLRFLGTLILATLGFFGYKWYCTNAEVLSKSASQKNNSSKMETQSRVKDEDPASQPDPSTPRLVKLQSGGQNKRSPTEKAVLNVSRESTAKSNKSKQSLRRKPPTAMPTISTPIEVTYSDGVPKDVGFGRGDQQQQCPGIWLSAKIYIPEVENYSFIGRILGPRGISVRRLEAETECKILIRGRGSIKDEKREQYLLTRPGWAHLRDKLHILLLANDESSAKICRERLEGAVQVIQRLLIPQYDEYKRQQLMHLAILNGTYRPA